MNIHDEFTKKAKQTIESHRMIASGDIVVCAVSGGADSVALLCLLKELSTDMCFELLACHVNHLLRGDESTRDMEFVSKLCRELQVPLKTFECNISENAKKYGRSVEEQGRIERYKCFSDCLEGKNGKIATAHSLNDSIETIVFNLTRGTGLSGLCGIPPVRDNIIRPLINISRDEIEDYIKDIGASFVTDSSNLSCEYTRNKIRKNILPKFLEINPSFLDNMRQNIEVLREENDYLTDVCDDMLRKIDSNAPKVSDLLLIKPAIRGRIIVELLIRKGIVPNYKKINSIEKLIVDGKGIVYLSADIQVFIEDSRIKFEKKKTANRIETRPIVFGQEILLGGNRRLITKHIERFSPENVKDLDMKNALDCDKLVGVLVVRCRIDGEKIELLGRGITKTVKKLFYEAGISSDKRDEIAILADDLGPVWILGFGVASRVAVNNTTTSILKIKT